MTPTGRPVKPPIRITIEATDTTTDLDGVPVRVWHGTTDNGGGVVVFVHRIMSIDPNADATLNRLVPQLPPGTFAPIDQVLAEYDAARIGIGRG